MSVVDMGRGSRPGDLRRRRVLLVAESAGLAAMLHHLLAPADRLSRIGSLRELAESQALEAADVVVLDVPAGVRAAAAVEEVRRRHPGPLVVLMAKGESIRGGPPDDGCVLLTRPFSVGDLGAALGGPGRPMATSTTTPAPDLTPPSWRLRGVAGVAQLRTEGVAAAPMAPTTSTAVRRPGVEVPPAAPKAADPKASARQAPVRPALVRPPGRPGLVERGHRLLATLTQGWQARRRVRVVGFSALALVAFTAAFALAVQGGRCGPGCDAFGTVFSPEPTVAPASSRVPTTTGPKRSTTTAATPSGYPSTGPVRGISASRLAPTTAADRQVTTTTGKPSLGGGGPASTTPTTRPATTATPTTQPATTSTPTTQPATTSTPTTGGA